MKITSVFGGFLFLVGLAATHATSEQCNTVFQAVVEMRGNLTNFFEGEQAEADKIKKAIFYWTNANVDDDATLRQGVCQIISANSIDEMAVASRIPRAIFPYIYQSLKYNGEWYKNASQELVTVLEQADILPEYLQAFHAYIHLWNVVVDTGLDRFQVPPEPMRSRGDLTGCQRMKLYGLRAYRDKEWIFPDSQSGASDLRSRTGIDLNDRQQVAIVLCKLGEVRDLAELSVVLNMPIAAVREDYADVVAGIRLIGTSIGSADGFHAIPQHVVQNVRRFLDTVQEVGLFNLTD